MERHDIEVNRGDTWDGKRFRIDINGAALPVGTTIRMDIRENDPTGPVIKSVSTGAGITLSYGTTYCYVDIDSFVVEFSAGVFYYDIEFNMDGRIKTYIGGKFTVIQDTTRDG